VPIFVGNPSHIAQNSAISIDYFQSVEWFAQVRQDEIVSALLRRKKSDYFIDLAANDGFKISNTYALETCFGWGGLCIEHNPQYWAGLSYRKCHVVGAVIGAQNMQEVQFKYPNRFGPKGGIVGEQFDNKEASKFGEDRPRYTVTLCGVFERYRSSSSTVTVKDADDDMSLGNLTRKSLPYFQPWYATSGRNEVPPDFGWISSSCGGKAWSLWRWRNGSSNGCIPWSHV
jgi:hypothetical protein